MPCKLQGITSQEFGGRSCHDLANEANSLRDELAKRVSDLINNKYNLQTFGKQSIKGHIDQMAGKQSRLRRILNELSTRKASCCCSNSSLKEDSWKYATVESPVNDPSINKVAVVLGITAAVAIAFFATPAVAGTGLATACLAAFTFNGNNQ